MCCCCIDLYTMSATFSCWCIQCRNTQTHTHFTWFNHIVSVTILRCRFWSHVSAFLSANAFVYDWFAHLGDLCLTGSEVLIKCFHINYLCVHMRRIAKCSVFFHCPRIEIRLPLKSIKWRRFVVPFYWFTMSFAWFLCVCICVSFSL